jgi:hypothetical protein
MPHALPMSEVHRRTRRVVDLDHLLPPVFRCSKALQPGSPKSFLGHRSFHQREMVSQTPIFPFRAGKSADGGAEVAAVVVSGGEGDEAGGDTDVATVAVAGGGGDEADGGAEVSAVVIGGGGGDEGGGGPEVAAVVVTGGGDEASGGPEVAAVVFAGFAFVRAAGGFMAPGANGASSAMTGSGVMTVVGAVPESPDCMELDSFTAILTGTLCG